MSSQIVDVSNNDLWDSHAHELAQTISTRRATELHASNNNFGPLACATLSLAPAFSQLRVVSLSGNRLGNAGIQSLADVLTRSSCTIESLNVSSNFLRHEAAETLARVLGTTGCRSLKQLDMSNNLLQHEGISALLAGVGRNRSLRSLNISSCYAG